MNLRELRARKMLATLRTPRKRGFNYMRLSALPKLLKTTRQESEPASKKQSRRQSGNRNPEPKGAIFKVAFFLTSYEKGDREAT